MFRPSAPRSRPASGRGIRGIPAAALGFGTGVGLLAAGAAGASEPPPTPAATPAPTLVAPTLAAPTLASAGLGAGETAAAPNAATPNAAGVVVLAQISGMVVTSDGQPLPGALVSVFASEQPEQAQFAVTDDDGRFEVDEASEGLYSLRAFLAGFLPSPRTRVQVSSGAALTDTLLLQLAAVGAEPGAGTLSELRWLLQRGRRNVLKERQASLGSEWDDEGEWFRSETRPHVPALGAFDGEFGVFAASGSSLGLAEGRALDSGIAYTRFELPSTARGDWEAEARLMESAFASWAANLAYRMAPLDGHRFSAGLGYQRHVYGDAPDYRPEAAPILNADLLQEPQAAWDGAAFVADDFSLGRASLSTGLTYRRFSYLSGHRGLAPRAVLRYRASDDWELVGGMAVRVDGPIGDDAALLSRVAHADLLALDPSGFPTMPAQRSARYQAGVQYRLAPNATLGVRGFREVTTDQLVRSFESRPRRGGRFDVASAGDFTAQGFAFDWIRELAPVARGVDLGGRVSYLMAVVGGSPEEAAIEAPIEAPIGVLAVTDGAVLHDLSAEVEAQWRPSGTRLNAVYRLITHDGITPPTAPAAGPAAPAGDRTARFDVEILQLIPFTEWSGTEWELSFAVRDLFFRDLMGRSLLDELAVARAPRRVVGGLAVRF